MKGRRLSRRPARVLAVLLGLLATAVAAPQVGAAATFTVNTNDDGNGTCTALHCSLREAIKAANANAGHDLIVFDIGGGGPQTIEPLGQSLPAVTDPVTIDATTQPGYVGKPIVELDGSLAGPGAVGFDVPAGQSVITGFVVDGFGFGLGGSGTGYGIRLAGEGGTTIVGNYIGTDLSGSAAPRPNDLGIFVESADNTIGGTTPDKRNVISGNGAGLLLYGVATRNTVIGDYIGTDAAGAHAVGNSAGVEVSNDTGVNVIGGDSPAEGNLISGNRIGVLIEFTGAGNLVRGNLIGTDATGLAPISVSGQIGVLIVSTSGSVIGGPSTDDRNVISGNSSGGVALQGPGNVLANNYVGVGIDGQTPVPNGAGGVFVDASDNTVGVGLAGSPVQGGPNVIAYNSGQGGVVVRFGTQSPILGNSIHSNAGLGIDLYPSGPTPNDPGDADTGANELQNFPVLDTTSTSGGSVTVDGTLSSHPNTTYELEFFANAVCDPSGFGEGQELLGDRSVTTDGSGNAGFSFSFAAGTAGSVITSTATDPAGNTSEFSKCAVATTASSGSVTTLSPPTATNPVGSSHTVTAQVVSGSATPAPLGGVTVYFTVTGSVSTSGTCTTGATGTCDFTYQGPDLPGADLITAYADANANGTQDPTEVSGGATKAWLLPASTLGQVTGGGHAPALDGEIAFGFNAENKSSGVKGNCNVVDRASNLHLKCLTVTNLVVAATHATFFGQASLDGVTTNYRIDVDDLAEPGRGRDTFKVQTDTGFVAGGVLTEGNIQIHS